MQEPKPSRAWALRAALILAIATAVFAIFMRVEAMGFEISGDASSCKISSEWDCDRVQSSQYGRLFGVSLSLWGAAGHIVLSLFLAGWLRRRESTYLWLAGLVVLFNVGASATTFYLAMHKIGAFCLYCTILQTSTVVLAALVFAGMREGGRIGMRWAPLCAAGLMTATTFVATFAVSTYVETLVASERLRTQDATRKVRLDVSDAIRLGDPSTPNSVLLFVDFGCPECQKCFRKALVLQKRFPRDVHFLFKNYPLDKVCNSELQRTTNAESCSAAFAAVAANRSNRGPQAMHAFFLDRTGGFHDFFFEDFARAQGIDVKEFIEARNGSAVREAVKRDIPEGNGMDFDRVPMVYLNGRHSEPDYLEDRVTRAIRRR